MKASFMAILVFAAPIAATGELAVNSPFGPPQAVPPDAGGGPALELRGIMRSAEGVRYCVFDPQRNSSTWAAVSEASEAFVIRSADPEAEEITLDANGHVLTVRLRRPKVATLTPEGNAPTHAISYQLMSRRQPGEPRAPRTATN